MPNKDIITTFASHQEELNFLKEQGFLTNSLNKTVDNIEQIWQYSQEIQSKKGELKYPIDGVVVKLNSNQVLDLLGVVGKTNRGWCAIKFTATQVVTNVKKITWQVGRTGKVTPVAELEPVQLDGTTVQRATLHNYQEFLNKDLQLGDAVIIQKAGDIIPEVVKVLTKLRQKKSEQKSFKAPKKCPSCETILKETETGIDLLCPNQKTCKAQIQGRLSYFSQRKLGNIEGLSQKIIAKFIDEFGISDIADLFDLPYQKIIELEGFGSKSLENLQSSIQKAKQINDSKFLAGLGIEGVGIEVAKLIIQKAAEKESK